MLLGLLVWSTSKRPGSEMLISVHRNLGWTAPNADWPFNINLAILTKTFRQDGRQVLLQQIPADCPVQECRVSRYDRSKTGYVQFSRRLRIQGDASGELQDEWRGQAMCLLCRYFSFGRGHGSAHCNSINNFPCGVENSEDPRWRGPRYLFDWIWGIRRREKIPSSNVSNGDLRNSLVWLRSKCIFLLLASLLGR